MRFAEAEVTELRTKGVDILPSMVVNRDRAASASNHPDDANTTSLGEENKAKAEAEAKHAAEQEQQRREEAETAADKAAVADGKMTAEDYEKRAKERFDARLAREKAAASSTAGAQTKAGEQAPGAQDKGQEGDTPKKPGFQKRIDELTKKAGDALRAKEKAEADAAENKRRADEAEAALKKAQEQKVPQRGDFDTEDAYLAALTAHSATVAAAINSAETAKREAEAARKSAETTAQGAQEEAGKAVVEQWNARQEEARERLADFDKVALRQDIKVSPALALIVMQSEIGADVQYFLGSKPEEAERLSKIGDPLALAREVGRIESILLPKVEEARKAKAAAGGGAASTTEVPSKAATSVSSAPAPLTPSVGGAASSTVLSAAEAAKLPMNEYVKARAEGRIR